MNNYGYDDGTVTGCSVRAKELPKQQPTRTYYVISFLNSFSYERTFAQIDSDGRYRDRPLEEATRFGTITDLIAAVNRHGVACKEANWPETSAQEKIFRVDETDVQGEETRVVVGENETVTTIPGDAQIKYVLRYNRPKFPVRCAIRSVSGGLSWFPANLMKATLFNTQGQALAALQRNAELSGTNGTTGEHAEVVRVLVTPAASTVSRTLTELK